MPFDLDRVFTGIPSPKEESWKDKGVRLAKEEYSKAIEAFMQHVVEEPESFSGSMPLQSATRTWVTTPMQ
jgi:hypothetical protein